MQRISSSLFRMLLLACLLALRIGAVTLEQIENTPGLTPQKFAAFFSRFDFRYSDRVQRPEEFLASQAGDCDDYAILAARVLQAKGYTPRLIAIRMPALVHVVCYIEETRSYLDYNQRASLHATVRSSGDIADIARSVARSYGSKWTSASEFVFDNEMKRLVQTVVDHRDRQIAAILP